MRKITRMLALVVNNLITVTSALEHTVAEGHVMLDPPAKIFIVSKIASTVVLAIAGVVVLGY